MKLPVDQTKIAALETGEHRPVLVYGADETRTDRDGPPLFQLPVLISGTSNLVKPSTIVSLPGPIDSVANGQALTISQPYSCYLDNARCLW